MTDKSTTLTDASRVFAERVYAETADLVGIEVGQKLLLDVFDKEDLVFAERAVSIKAARPEKGVSSFIHRISKRLSIGFGIPFVEKVLQQAWKQAKKEVADEKVLVGLLELIPNDYLTDARVQYISRENLESLAIQTAKELRQINEGLEETVQRRTDELTKANEALTESKQALEQQLAAVAAEKERIEAIISSIGEGVLAVDTEGTIFLVNHVAAQLLGCKHEELLHHPLSSFLDLDEESGSPLALVDKVLERKEAVHIPEANYTHPAGEKLIFTFVATPVEMNGVVSGVIIVFHDVTEQKLVEKVKQQFISTAAHQLRTPLSGIMWALSLLLETRDTLSNEQKVLTMKSYESTKRLISLVNDLLHVGRIESGRMDLEFVPTDIVALVNNILFDLTPRVQHKQIKVQLQPSGDIPRVELDQEKVRAVFQNLLENAITYTPENGTIAIGIEKKNDTVLVHFADSGIGIPRNQRKQIFTRFFRAANAVAYVPDGSGLGLFIAKQIIDMHHGRIWFESEVNQGTTFYVEFPITVPKSASEKNDKK